MRAVAQSESIDIAQRIKTSFQQGRCLARGSFIALLFSTIPARSVKVILY